jgi:hypothetical protein
MAFRRGSHRRLLVPAFLGLATLVYIEVHPSHVVAARNPGWLDDIFASDVVLAFVRLALVMTAVYVGVSIVGLVSEGRWLTELGPAKATQARVPLERLDATSARLREDLHDEHVTTRALKAQLEASGSELAKERAATAFLLDRVDTLERESERNRGRQDR